MRCNTAKNMTNLITRRAQESDVPEMEILLNELGYQVSTKALSIQLDIYSQPGSIAFVAACHETNTIHGLVSGHVIPLLHQHGYLGRITSMVVSKDSRGSGVGLKLIEELEAWFGEKQCLRYEVTSGEHRDMAHQFYEKHGYLPDERRFIKIP